MKDICTLTQTKIYIKLYNVELKLDKNSQWDLDFVLHFSVLGLTNPCLYYTILYKADSHDFTFQYLVKKQK